MLKLTFKDVGQGDSIIIEWEESNSLKIAIIDCNLYNSRNPVLNHLIQNEYKEIEYLILSHPHYDHFSGMNEILEYFAVNNFQIKYFLHTSKQVPDFLKMASISAIAEKELQNLFLSLRKLSGILKMKVALVQYDHPSNTIPLGSNYSLTFLSPSFKEFDNYIKNISVFESEEDGLNNPNANWLSTIIRININNSYLLLTSDSEKYSLVRIDKKESLELSHKMLLGQSPHHGSKSNHNNAFWKKRNRIQNTPLVFSVGTNNYNHPSKEIVDFFNKNYFDIYSTNKTGGLLELDNKSKGIENTRYLEIFSRIDEIHNNKFAGDKVFVF